MNMDGNPLEHVKRYCFVCNLGAWLSALSGLAAVPTAGKWLATMNFKRIASMHSFSVLAYRKVEFASAWVDTGNSGGRHTHVMQWYLLFENIKIYCVDGYCDDAILMLLTQKFRSTTRVRQNHSHSVKEVKWMENGCWARAKKKKKENTIRFGIRF